jgi:hypothetical protein
MSPMKFKFKISRDTLKENKVAEGQVARFNC